MRETSTTAPNEKHSSPDLEKAISKTVAPESNDTPSLSSDTEPSNNWEGHQCSASRESVTTEKQTFFQTFVAAIRTEDTGEDPGPPPDGGFEAWLQAFLAHGVTFNTWGFANSFGMFQDYYTETLKRSPSDIAWVGSIQIAVVYGIGTFSGRFTDAGFFKPVWSIGALTTILGVFMTSLCKSYWQLFLAQGICQGVGCGLMFCPAIALLSTYFTSRRSIALAIAACGSASGAVIYPVIVQQLLPRIGFQWTMRVIGLVATVTLAPGFIFFRQRIPPRRTGPLIEWSAFKEAAYSLCALGMYLNFWGLYVGYFYVTSFARKEIGFSQSQAITLIMIINGLGVPGRLIPSFAADWYVGPCNAVIPCTLATAAMLFAWIGVKDSAGMYVFASLFGFFSSGLLSLFLAVLTSLSTDLKKAGVRFGMLLTIIGVASLTGPPIAGAIIQKSNGDYLGAQVFAGIAMLAGTFVLILGRVAQSGPKLMVKI